MEALLDGFRQFRATAFQDHEERFRRLAVVGQSPKAVVISCCDSRVDPQLIFSAAPGDLFIIRNVANLVPPYHPNADYHGTSAALEFAVCNLGVQHAIVMGHTLCGGIRALVSGGAGGDFIGAWMSIASGVRERVLAEGGPKDAAFARAEREAIRHSLENLRTFPWVKEREDDGRLSLHGCLFDLSAADLSLLDAASGEFRSVAQ